MNKNIKILDEFSLLIKSYVVLFEPFWEKILDLDFYLVEDMFLVVIWKLLDFYLYLFNLLVIEFKLLEAALNIFLADNTLGEKERFLGELMFIFWVWVNVMLVLVVILG